MRSLPVVFVLLSAPSLFARSSPAPLAQPLEASFLQASQALFAQPVPIPCAQPSPVPHAQSSQVIVVRPQVSDRVVTVEPRVELQEVQPVVPEAQRVMIVRPDESRSPVAALAPRLLRQSAGQALLVRSGQDEGALAGPKAGDPWLGLSMRALRDGAPRLVVEKVIGGSPAEAAGVEAGDKLVALAGRPVTTHAELMDVLRAHRTGKRLSLTVERTRKIELGASQGDSGVAFLGVSAADEPARAGEGVAGLPLTSVEGESAAVHAGLRRGDRIAAVDGVEVGSFAELSKRIQAHSPGDAVELRVQRDVQVVLAPRPGKSGEQRRSAGQEGGESAEAGAAPGRGQDSGALLFRPEGDSRRFWSSPEAGAQAGESAPRARLAEPRAPKRGQGPAAGGGAMADLLHEIRALRAEVSELRREIETLRSRR
jgi:membrane-associated protease RseP (regulator of RpoE activity)